MSSDLSQNAPGASARSNSFSQQSQASDESQTAAEYIRSQELLEADAREALPYRIDSCTKILGPLRQSVFACLTCTPPPAKPAEQWTPAGVCYACSVQCHGEHTLVEIFQKRNFTCDCGTTRLPSTSPCTLRTNETNTKGNVSSEEPDVNNKYNQNFRNRFCSCECDYDPFEQKGTMFQCLGLGDADSGGCGEDWYHPGCLVGMGPQWFEKMESTKAKKPVAIGSSDQNLATITEEVENGTKVEKPAAGQGEEEAIDEDDDPPMPPGFPDEDAFEGFLCYKCVESHPWIKQYAGTSGFLPAVFTDNTSRDESDPEASTKKRKADDEDETQNGEAKRVKTESRSDKTSSDAAPTKSETPAESNAKETPSDCKLRNFRPAPSSPFSLFFKEDFREQFCHCTSCYRLLNAHPQLLEEEEVYEPPISEDGGGSPHGGGSTKGSGSLLERGESALHNVDRVRAIEGVMAYNHLKEKLQPFFKQFAESGQAIGAEDIKAYFAKLRGDEDGMQEAGEAAATSKKDGKGDDGEGSGREEQSGY